MGEEAPFLQSPLLRLRSELYFRCSTFDVSNFSVSAFQHFSISVCPLLPWLESVIYAVPPTAAPRAPPPACSAAPAARRPRTTSPWPAAPSRKSSASINASSPIWKSKNACSRIIFGRRNAKRQCTRFTVRQILRHRSRSSLPLHLSTSLSS